MRKKLGNLYKKAEIVRKKLNATLMSYKGVEDGKIEKGSQVSEVMNSAVIIRGLS